MCNECMYESCRIYKDTHRDTHMWFGEWVEEFHQEYYNNNNYYGVDPLFEPLETHMTNQEQLVERLKEKGIDHNNCQFLHPEKGCLIPFEKRPEGCKKEIHVCRKIYEELETDELKIKRRIKTKERDQIYFTYQTKEMENPFLIDVLIYFNTYYDNKVSLRVYKEVFSPTLDEQIEKIKNHLEKKLKEIPKIRVKLVVEGLTFYSDQVDKIYEHGEN